MIHVAICDDEKEFVKYLSELLRQYGAQTSREIKITVYYDGLELIERYDPTIDLIFLDIQMRRVDGLRAAKKIRKLDEKVGIIFLTTMTEYSLEGYQYQAADYIIKPLKYVRLKAEMDRFLKRLRQMGDPAILVFNDTGRYKVRLKSLRYIETFNRNLLLHTEEENIICYRSMKEMEAELRDQGFARCHTSYLVNLYFIQGVKRLELTLATGEKLPISQPRRKVFMERLTDYWGERL